MIIEIMMLMIIDVIYDNDNVVADTEGDLKK